LIDIATISTNSINSSNRYKADTHLLWQHISDSYKLQEFLANDKPLLKIKRPKYHYTVDQAIQEHVALANKAYFHDVVVDEQFYCEVLTAQGKVCRAGFRGLYSKNKEPANDSAVGA